jgi:uncharacterized protein YbjQ (UPF0145 family)
MYCETCGKKVGDKDSVCPACGASLKARAQRTGKLALYTSNYVPGFAVDKVLGLTYGITVRSRGIGGNIIAGLRTIAGGEINEYTEMAQQARQQALDRLSEHAAQMGANAVISVMFDSTAIGNTMDEIIAFGTAVIVVPADASQQRDVKLS